MAQNLCTSHPQRRQRWSSWLQPWPLQPSLGLNQQVDDLSLSYVVTEKEREKRRKGRKRKKKKREFHLSLLWAWGGAQMLEKVHLPSQVCLQEPRLEAKQPQLESVLQNKIPVTLSSLTCCTTMPPPHYYIFILLLPVLCYFMLSFISISYSFLVVIAFLPF